ncbi:unnamed protein product, partial [Arabidopsis halleri]
LLFVDLYEITRFLPRVNDLKFMIIFPKSSESETPQFSASLLEKWMHEKNLVMSMKKMDATASKAHKVVKVTCWIVQAVMFFPLTGLVGSSILELFTTACCFCGWKYLEVSLQLANVLFP